MEAVAAGEDLDGLGVVIDFEHLKKVVGEVAARFHYRDMNEHAGPGRRQPVGGGGGALLLPRRCRKGLGAEGRLLRRVRVWEAPGCIAPSYAE